MAFVEVIRRSMRPEEWTDLRYSWLRRGIIKEKYEIKDLRIRDARQISEDKFEYYPEGWRPLVNGDMYFTPDGTAFIEGEVTIPEKMRGKELWLYHHTAAEMIVKVNGKYAGGIDPNRDRMLITPFIGKDGKVKIEIEGYNRSKPDDERNPESMASRGCRQIFTGMYIVTINHDVLGLYYDMTMLIDVTKSRHFDEDARAYIAKELNAALNFVDFDTFEGADKARDYIEKRIYQNTDFRSSGNVALIGHSHLDIAYYWRRIHVVEKNARTILIQMRLMDQYPDFHYTHTQPYVYETLEKYHPELFAELKEKVKSGQFEPVGAMYVEPDCNIPSAESLIRQCLYGQHYYRRAFGITVDTAWLPDVFGNSWILPQILKKTGVNYFISNKMSTWNDTNRFPHNNFLWKGLDGTMIYACVPPTHFITWNMPSQIMENWDAYQDKERGGATLSMFGYGDGGSGATEEMIEMMHRFDKLSLMPKTKHMRADEYLHSNFDGNTELSVWDGELYLEMHRGTFTTKSNLKAYNRKLESKLRNTEIVSLIRNRNGKKYPADEIRDAYKRFLLNQFHDILPGSHINPVYEDAIADYQAVDKDLDSILSENGDYYFNSLNWKREGVHFIESESGKSVRHGVNGYFAYPAIDSLSSSKIEDRTSGDTSWLKADGNKVSTPYYEIEFGNDGSFACLRDAETGREWVKGGFNKLHLYQDTPGMYDAWDILPNYDEVEYELSVEKPLSLDKADSVSAEFSAVLKTPGGKSTWRLVIRLFAASPEIETEHIVDWDEKHKLMKAEFACNVLSRSLVTDTSAGFAVRETHKNTTWQQARFEVSTHLWTDFSETDGGIAVINEGKYGLGVQEDGFTVSLLRSNIRPDIMSDIGHHDFCLTILPHKGSAVESGINKRAIEYNTPLVKTAEPLSASWDFGPLYLEAAKLSEDGKKIIYRLSEQDGKRGTVDLGRKVETLNMLEDHEGWTEKLEYKPFEIITIAEDINA